MKYRGYNEVVSSLGNSTAQKFGLGRKELNDELGLEWYDFGARNYDVALGRWMNIDPLAENYSSTSPYVYTLNNPLFFVDPDGRKIINGDEERRKKAEKQVEKNRKIVESAESSYGTSREDFSSRSQYKRYKKAKRNLKKSQRKLSKYTRLAESTQEKIDNFKEKSPNMFAKMDNITNEYGESVDIFVGTKSMSGKNGKNEFSFSVDQNNGHVRLSSRSFGLNTLEIFINPTLGPSVHDPDKTPSTIETLRHEMGHASYEIESTRSYYLYLEGLKRSGKKSNAGHSSGDLSGKRALLWETLEDL
ncbi:RHS repeat-associated core domain-containing protein [Tenacibaculum agarivorans]|uniref:RHS repeat-associated core domain-containing protein n=1 Tax=Tenacibaculum agarivorans TaxID=1908389 RepID=UPI00094BC35C|nr:RHS repeat-associated core domain-containing protein [Tenacibaculum agarivorans]